MLREESPSQDQDKPVIDFIIWLAEEDFSSAESIERFINIYSNASSAVERDEDTLLSIIRIEKGILNGLPTETKKMYCDTIQEYCVAILQRNKWNFYIEHYSELSPENQTLVNNLLKENLPPDEYQDLQQFKKSLEEQHERYGWILEGDPPGTLNFPRILQTSHLIHIVAGCDQGEAPTANEDRTVLIEYQDPVLGLFVSVIDGIGGNKDGQKVAKILAETMSKGTDITSQGRVDFDLLLARTAVGIKQSEPAVDQHAGACLMAAHIRPDQENGTFRLDTFQLGDCRIMVLDEKGEMVYVSCDEGWSEHVWLEEGFVRKSIRVATNDFRNNLVTNSFGWQRRNEVRKNTLFKGIDFYEQQNPIRPSKIRDPDAIDNGFRLEPGWRVLLFSDGLEMFTRAELANAIKGLNTEQAFSRIAALSDLSMSDTTTNLLDGLLISNFIKKDHRSLIVIDIPGKTESPHPVRPHPISDDTMEIALNDLDEKAIPSNKYRMAWRYIIQKNSLTVDDCIYSIQSLCPPQGSLDFTLFAENIPKDNGLPELYAYALSRNDVTTMLRIIAIAKEHIKNTIEYLKKVTS